MELLKAKTAREVGLLEQQNKLREAELKARSDKTAARGKGDAAGAKAGGKGASGLGADKGGRKTGPQGPAPKQQPRPQQQMKQQAPASKPRSPKQPAPAPKQQPKLQGPAPKQSKGDDKPRQKDGAGDRKVDLSKGDRLKKTPDGTKGAGGGKSPAPGPKGGTDSKSGRDRRKIRYDEPKKLPSGVRHGSADAYDEHQCRCRRCVNAAHLAGKRAETKGADTTGPGGRKTSENSPEPPSESPKEGGGPTGPEGAAKGAEQPSDGSSAPGGGTSKSRPGPGFDGGSAEGPGWTGNRKETPKWPGHDRPPRRADQGEDDIVDADIVPGEPMAVTTGGKGLPPAPEERIERPGTTRPTAQEDPVASQVSKPASGQAGMAAKHRTDITFGEYLTEIVNIAIAAGVDEDRAQELAAALGKVADALRDMAADLVGDHNIATEVVNQITDLADAASRMKQLAERCATECEIASQAARLAATAVGRTYREDIQAMDDAGLANASSAAHHN
ncbi:ATP/GTP-binding protein (plasmid) [Streptomyces sp. NBC_01527]|uniref:ATP/GTP-binding protein n=1 Tax=unclassified Streptomyces TaxID=2593676 RepID=UPI002E121976|nr:ATP/GTP-binding protein [Streptomyces sp. NBC_01230]